MIHKMTQNVRPLTFSLTVACHGCKWATPPDTNIREALKKDCESGKFNKAIERLPATSNNANVPVLIYSEVAKVRNA